MIPQGPFSPFHQQRWIELYNDGSATIPAFGIAEISDAYRPDTASAETPAGGRTALKVKQPTADNVANFVINGPIPIAASKTGFGTQDYPCYVAYTGSTPVFGAEWGPASGTCLATTGKRGLIIYGDASSGLVRVARKGAVTTYSPTIAQLSGTLDAVDYSGATLAPNDTTTLTSTASGTVFGVKGTYSYQQIESAAAIVNSTPFKFLSGSFVRVVQHGSVWVAVGTVHTPIGYYANAVHASVASTMLAQWSAASWSIGNLITSSGTTLTVAAPLPTSGSDGTMLFHIEWKAKVSGAFPASSNQVASQVNLLINSVSVSAAETQHNFAFTEGTGTLDGLTQAATHTSWLDTFLKQSDTIQLQAVLSGSTSLQSMAATIRITPMAGSTVG